MRVGTLPRMFQQMLEILVVHVARRYVFPADLPLSDVIEKLLLLLVPVGSLLELALDVKVSSSAVQSGLVLRDH